ncbi:uncharacterized protein LOC144100383 [Amblyomma americanum]
MASTHDNKAAAARSSDMFGVENCVETYDMALEPTAPPMVAILEAFEPTFLNANDIKREFGAESSRERRQFIDVGCGSGSFTLKYLLPRLPTWCERLVGADISEAMLKFAREKRADPRIDYKALDLVSQDDVAKFVREEGHFQRVYSFLALHWMTDQRHAMKNIETLMANGGECLLVFSSKLDVHDIFTAVKSSPRWSKYSHVFDGLLPETSALDNTVALRSYATDLVRATNLIPLACEVVHTTATIGLDMNAAADFFTLLNPVYKLLNEDEKAELQKFTLDVIEDVRKRYASSGSSRDFLVIHAYKPKN